MNPEQALQLLDNAVAKLPVDRQSHATLVQAVNILRGAITVEEELEKETAKED